MGMIRFRHAGVDYQVARARLSYDPRLRSLLKRSYVYGVDTFFKPTPRRKERIEKTKLIRLKLKKKPIRRVTRRPRRRWSRARIMRTRPISPFETQQLKRQADKYNVPRDVIDWESEIDKSLTYSENKRMIMKKIRVLSPKSDHFLEFNLEELKGEKKKYLNGLKFRISTGNHTALGELKYLKRRGFG